MSERTLRRRLQPRQPGDALLLRDGTLLGWFPPRRAAWSRVGASAVLPMTGRKAQRVRFGALNLVSRPI